MKIRQYVSIYCDLLESKSQKNIKYCNRTVNIITDIRNIVPWMVNISDMYKKKKMNLEYFIYRFILNNEWFQYVWVRTIGFGYGIRAWRVGFRYGPVVILIHIDHWLNIVIYCNYWSTYVVPPTTNIALHAKFWIISIPCDMEILYYYLARYFFASNN